MLIPILALALQAQVPDSATFVTRLGADTLAVERVVRTGNSVEAHVLLRAPRTTRNRWVLTLSSGGGIERMDGLTMAVDTAGNGVEGSVRREVITRVGDSLRVETTGGERARTTMVGADAMTLPFIDMVHWPYDVALRRDYPRRPSAGALPLLSGGRIIPFRYAFGPRDSATLTHPLRGTMRVRIDGTGRLVGLDAGATTRKLVVERRPWMPDAEVGRLAARWGALDAAGRGIGALSGRAQARGRVGGATVEVDYGTPAMRGRAVWGALVPFGQLWRTGANEATHLTTDAPLVLGTGRDTLTVPAGRFTLFSIPAADGGLLIVNRQTGQGGTTYDASRDLGRVRLARRPLRQPVEVFTIVVDDALRLQWADAELLVPVRAR